MVLFSSVLVANRANATKDSSFYTVLAGYIIWTALFVTFIHGGYRDRLEFSYSL